MRGDQHQLQEIEGKYTAGFYSKRDLSLVSGLGVKVVDGQGREYIDCATGQGVALVGHCNPYVVDALNRQASQLLTCPEMFYNDKRGELLEKLAQITPPGLDRFFLCNSGTEALEGAIKSARLATGKKGILAMKRGFHGRTMGALSATWQPKYREPFEPLVPGFRHLPFNNLEALEEALDDDTAAVVVEPVQGEGGVFPADRDYLLGVAEACRKRNVLLIFDEVQTGFGRTGHLFALEHYGVVPDILCLAKGMAGGVPMGAVAFGPRVGELPKRAHGSTFGGNPLACAAACGAIDFILEHHLPSRAAQLGQFFREKLARIPSPLIKEVRGLGLMVGVQLKERAGSYIAGLMEQGVLALAAGPTVIRYLPPLVIEEEDLEFVVEKTAKVLEG